MHVILIEKRTKPLHLYNEGIAELPNRRTATWSSRNTLTDYQPFGGCIRMHPNSVLLR